MYIFRLAQTLRKNAAGAFAALRDARVPMRLKLMAAAAVLFVLSPLNLLGDIPLLGFVDDAMLLGVVLSWFTRASGPFMATIESGSLARR